MKKKILSLLLAAISILNLCPFSIIPAVAEESPTESQSIIEEAPVEPAEDYIKDMVTLSCQGGDDIELKKGEKIYAFTTLEPELGEGVNYLWQLKTENGNWATVTGYVLPFATISNALISNAILEDGTAHMRCVVEKDGKKYVSNELIISLAKEHQTIIGDRDITDIIPPISFQTTKDKAYAMSSPKVAAETEAETTVETEAEAENDSPPSSGSTAADAFHVVISYTYRHDTAASVLELDGKTAANTYTVTLPEGGYYSGTIATPPEIGYLPYVKLEQEKYVTGYSSETKFPDSYYIEYDNEQYVLANSIQFENQSEEITVEVFFIPQNVTFRVKVYEQNLYDDEYILAETITYVRTANEEVGEGYDEAREGFSPLYYDPKLPISEDGSFAIDIYYDRNYYLIEFDYNDNGNDAYGATNIFVRYKTPVVLPTPICPGYSFINWNLLEVTDDKKQPVDSDLYSTEAQGGYLISSIKHNLKYSASWKTETTSYTVIYWLENTEDTGFTLDSFEVIEGVTPGAVVDAEDTLDIPDKGNFTFNETLSDKNIKVAADGTTAVNAYYLRNYYTLTFYGNTNCIIPEHTHNADCPQGNCSLQAHSHSMACGIGTITCNKDEHIHEKSCCYFQEEDHTHSDACCAIPFHIHDITNYSDCIKTEHPVHHTGCYSRNELTAVNSLSGTPKTAYENLIRRVTGPLNGYIYRIRATRNGTIYNFFYVHNQWFFLGQGTDYNGVSYTGRLNNPNNNATSATSAQATTVCGQELHAHGDGTCVCNKEEHDHTSGCTCDKHVHGNGNCSYTCGKEHHRHDMNCYTFNCGKQSHTHTADCVRSCQQVVHTHNTCNNTTNNKNFLQIRYKYDADISGVWTTVGTAFPNGERWKANTYFNEVLVYLPFMPPTNITFTVNEGTANKIYNIFYYLESLDNTGTPYNDRYFDLSNSVNAEYNHLTKAEDFFNIRGFTQFESNPEYDNNDQVSLNNGGSVSMYYTRNNYYLEYVSMGTTLSTLTKSLKYQQPIGASCEVMAEDIPYPSNEEPGAIQFVGWYTTPNCADGTEFIFDGSTIMPIGGLVLYAKWEACSYTVNVYSDVQKNQTVKPYPQTVLFGSYIPEPNHANLKNDPVTQNSEDPEKPLPPSYDEETKMIFAGWYYLDGATEKRFDFNTMPVKSNMDIYAKWTSRIPVNYTIRYVYKDGNNYIDIAEPSTGASLAGVTKSFVAKVGSDLFEKYRTGYFPEMRSHSMTMSSNEIDNVYFFVYTIPQKIKYTVTHTFVSDDLEKLFGEGKNTLTEIFTHTIEGEDIADSAAFVEISFREGITKDILVQAAKDQYNITLNAEQKNKLWGIIINLSPSAYLLNLKLTTNSDTNNATFKWELNANQAIYQTIYYVESLDGSEYTIYHTLSSSVTAGITVNADDTFEIEHFTLDPNHPNTVLKGEANSISWDPNTGELSEGLVLRLYYKRKYYDYTVYFYKQGTQITPQEGLTPVKKSAKYQEIIKIADEAIDIDGYTLVNGSETVTISSNNSQTVECFYQGLEVYYHYQVRGMGGTINDPTDTVAIGGDPPASKTLELWSDGFFVHAWYYSIGDGEEKLVPESWLTNNNMTISIPPPEVSHAGQTVYIYAEVLPTTRRFKVEGFASPENDPQAFVFKLEGTPGTPTSGINVTFIIFDVGHTDIALLPYGEYTLTTLHWAWRYGTPTSVSFNGETMGASAGKVTLHLDTTGDVIITYPSEIAEKWLTDDASGVVSIAHISS